MPMAAVVHILNQFFAGIGGEDKAKLPVGVLGGAAGAARGLAAELRERATVVATIYFGDNYFHEHKDDAKEAIVREVGKTHPDVVVVGPAFNAGRYGLAAAEICQTIAERLGLPCVTSMEPENPGAGFYREYRNEKVFLLPTGESAAAMGRALATMAAFACRLAAGSVIGPADREGYLPRGIRRLERGERSGVERAIDMLLVKAAGRPFVTELAMEVWDKV